MISKVLLLALFFAWGNVASSSHYRQQHHAPTYEQGVPLMHAAGSYGSSSYGAPASYHQQSQQPTSFVNIQMGGGSAGYGRGHSGKSLVDTYRQHAPSTIYGAGSSNTASYGARGYGSGAAANSYGTTIWGAGFSHGGSSYQKQPLYSQPAPVYKPAPVQVYRQPVQVYKQPVQVYRQPVQVYKQPVQVYKQPLYSQPAAQVPIYKPAPIKVTYRPAPQPIVYKQQPQVSTYATRVVLAQNDYDHDDEDDYEGVSAYGVAAPALQRKIVIAGGNSYSNLASQPSVILAPVGLGGVSHVGTGYSGLVDNDYDSNRGW